MSGETEQAVSGWTVDTLHGHIIMILEERTRHVDDRHASLMDLIHEQDRRYSERLAEKDKRDEQRYVAQQEGVDRALMAAEKAVSAALTAADRAISKAEDASERRLNILNEFRATVENLVKAAPTRNEIEPRFEALNEKIMRQITDSRDADDRLRAERQRDIAIVRQEYQQGLADLKQSRDTSEGKGSGYGASWQVAIAVLGSIGTVAGIVAVIFALSK